MSGPHRKTFGQFVGLNIEPHQTVEIGDLARSRFANRIPANIGDEQVRVVAGVIERLRIGVGGETVIAVFPIHISGVAVTGAVVAAKIHEAVSFDKLYEFTIRVELKLVVVEIVQTVSVIIKARHPLIDLIN